MRGWTARVGLRKPEWQCTDCWYRNQPCDHAELARMQAHRSRCRGGCPCTFTADCPHCAVGGFHQCKAAADADWAGALLGQMRWPGDPDHVSSHCGNRTLDGDHHATCDCPDGGPLDALVERQEAKRQMGRALPLPVPKREVATYELSDDARPCCHTTGPNHHPACQEAKQ